MLNRLEQISNIYRLFNELEVCKYLETKKQNYFGSKISLFNRSLERIKNEQIKVESNELPLNAGVVGDFDSGKSSVINSIIGEKLLVVNDEPTTAVISIIKYGECFKIRVNYKNGECKYINKNQLTELSNHVYDEDGNKVLNKNQQEVEHIEIYYPSDILININLIDTPGFSSISDMDDRITKAWLKNADILIWILDVNKGSLDNDELKLLEEVKKEVKDKDIIGVINKIDSKPPCVLERIINSYREQFNFNMIIPYSTKGEEFEENVEKFKEFLLLMQNNIKDQKIMTVNNDMTTLYNKSISNLEMLKINLKDIKDIKHTEADEVLDVTNNFINDFKEYANISAQKLSQDLFNDAKLIICKKPIGLFYSTTQINKELLADIFEHFSNEFSIFYEDKIEIFNTFLYDNSFNYEYKEAKEQLFFLFSQILQASFAAIKTIFQISEFNDHELKDDMIKRIIEGALPIEQLNNILHSFFENAIIELRKNIFFKNNEFNHAIDGMISDINSVLL